MPIDALIKELLQSGSMNEDTTADLNRMLAEFDSGALHPDDADYITALHARLTGAPPPEAALPSEPGLLDGLSIEGWRERALGGSLARQLESTLHLEVASLERIARLWNSLGRLPQASWGEEVERVLRGFPAYQSIQWVGDDLRIRWLLPVAGNEAALNLKSICPVAMPTTHSSAIK